VIRPSVKVDEQIEIKERSVMIFRAGNIYE